MTCKRTTPCLGTNVTTTTLLGSYAVLLLLLSSLFLYVLDTTTFVGRRLLVVLYAACAGSFRTFCFSCRLPLRISVARTWYLPGEEEEGW